jgi:hypothetical protein
MFGWFRRQRALTSTRAEPRIEPEAAGDIAYHGLTDWWLYEFSAEEREIIRETYSPMGNPDYRIDRGAISASTQSTADFASSVAGWFAKEETRHIGYKFIRKADEYEQTDLQPMSVHFAMQARCQLFYRWRDFDDFALDEAIKACERGISVSKEAAAEFRRSWGRLDVSHYCYKQLAIIEEKRGNVPRAIELCNSAEAEGWMGDWAKRRVRLAKKLGQQ